MISLLLALIAFQGDDTDKIQKLIDAKKLIPAGDYRVGPIYVDQNNTYINGRNVTFHPLTKVQPVLLLGVRRVDKDNQKVTIKHRPDANGILDRSIAPNPGNWAGLRTNTDTTWQGSGSDVNMGPPINGVWDGYSTLKGLRINLCVQWHNGIVNPTSNDYTLFGMGINSQPYPFNIGVADNGQLILQLRMGDKNEGGTMFYWGKIDLPNDNKVHHLQWDHNLQTGISNFTDNGVPCLINGPLGVAIPAGHFAPNRGEYPFYIGAGPRDPYSDGDVRKRVDLTIWGAKVSDLRTDVPQSDYDRYFYDDKCIWAIDGLYTTPSRLMRVRTGSWAYAYLLAFPCLGQLGGVSNITIEGLRIEEGGPSIALGNALNVTLRDVSADYGVVGLGSIGSGYPTYPVHIDNCNFGGLIEAVGVTNTEIRAFGMFLSRGGTHFLRGTGANILWIGGMTNALGRYDEAIIQQTGLWGGYFTIIGVQHDNEGGKFTKSIYDIGKNVSVFARQNYNAGIENGVAEWAIKGATLDIK